MRMSDDVKVEVIGVLVKYRGQCANFMKHIAMMKLFHHW